MQNNSSLLISSTPNKEIKYDATSPRSPINKVRPSWEEFMRKNPRYAEIMELEKKLAHVNEKRKNWASKIKVGDTQANESLKPFNETIQHLKDKMHSLKYYPNTLFTLLESLEHQQRKEEEKFTQFEQETCTKLQLMLKTMLETERRTLCNMQNNSGETVLSRAVISKNYQFALQLLAVMNDEEIQLTDIDGQTFLDIMCGHRLEKGIATAALSIKAIIKQLYERNVLRPLLSYHQLHIAIIKAAHTQQVEIVQYLLEFDALLLAQKSNESLSLLQIPNEHGDTALYIAISEHAKSGKGLPLIETLLKDIYECPLQITNEQQQTPFTLAQALAQSNMESKQLWGRAILNKLEQAQSRYRKRLKEWGYIPPDSKVTQGHREEAFKQSYETLIVLNPKDKNYYLTLYARYRDFYAPIMHNDHSEAQVLLSKIGETYRDDDRQAMDSVAMLQKLRQEIKTHTQSKDWPLQKTRAAFYEEIKKRIMDIGCYYRLLTSTGPETIHWLAIAATPIPSMLPATQKYLMGVPAVKKTLEQQEFEQAFLLAQEVAKDAKQQNKTTLQELLVLFPTPAQQATLISCYDWSNIPREAHATLLSCLFNQNFPELQLQQCLGLMDTYVFAKLFTNNTGLKKLELTGCDQLRLSPEHITQLAQGCPNLERLVLKEMDLSAIVQRAKLSLLFADSCVTFPACETLELINCTTLTTLLCTAPCLTRLVVDGCINLTHLTLNTPRLTSIHCRDTRKLYSLESKTPTLLPLAQILKDEQERKTITPRDSIVQPTKTTELHRAAQAGQLSVVRWWLNIGKAVNSLDQTDQTALHYAAKAGHAEIVDCLLRWSAEFSNPNRRGQTPLHLAARNGHFAVVSLLCNAGADPWLKDDKARTPIMLARLYRPEDGETVNDYVNIENLLSIMMDQNPPPVMDIAPVIDEVDLDLPDHKADDKDQEQKTLRSGADKLLSPPPLLSTIQRGQDSTQEPMMPTTLLSFAHTSSLSFAVAPTSSTQMQSPTVNQEIPTDAKNTTTSSYELQSQPPTSSTSDNKKLTSESNPISGYSPRFSNSMSANSRVKLNVAKQLLLKAKMLHKAPMTSSEDEYVRNRERLANLLKECEQQTVPTTQQLEDLTLLLTTLEPSFSPSFTRDST